MSEKRNKMLTMWVTEDEHRLLLERCGVHSFLHGCARLLFLFLLVLVGAYISTKGHNMSLLTAMLKRAVFHSITGPRAGFFLTGRGFVFIDILIFGGCTDRLAKDARKDVFTTRYFLTSGKVGQMS